MRKSTLSKITDKSILRYPGGKTRALLEIVPHFPTDIKEMCSPFFGGGSIELYMAGKGIEVHCYDIFKPLVEFWQILCRKPNELADQVSKHYPLAKEEFYKLQDAQEKLPTKMERAAAFYVLNRSSFSGSTMSGGMSPNHSRFTQSSIDRVREFYNPNFQVEKKAFNESLLLNKGIFAYLDPPYLIKQSLYGKDGNAHKGFDHVGLRDILLTRDNWIMSYNDSPEIRNMYLGFRIEQPSWKYGMSKKKSSSEVLIFSKDLEPTSK